MNPHLRLQRQITAALRKTLFGGKPAIPEAGELLWTIFIELSSARSGNGFGPNPISRAEIEAWMRISRMPLQAHHVATLIAMDRTWMLHAQAHTEKPGKDGVKRLPRLSDRRPINPAAFDAVFGNG